MAGEITFSVARRETDAPTGFELGDVTVEGPQGVATSIGTMPDQGMMIYVALVDLMSGVAKLTRDRKYRRYEFVGADSSYVLLFERMRADEVVIRYRKRIIGQQAARKIALALLAEVNRFWGEFPLAADDSCYEDFLRGRSRLMSALQGASGTDEPK